MRCTQSQEAVGFRIGRVTPSSTLYFGFGWSLTERPIDLPHGRERRSDGSPSHIYMSTKRRICSHPE